MNKSLEAIKIVMLVGKSQSGRIMYNALKDSFEIEAVIIEEKPSSLNLIKRRVTKIGLLKVIGQIMFVLFNRLFHSFSSVRINELIAKSGLNDKDIPKEVIRNVSSVNSKKSIDFLQKINPSIVIVNGTRIISNRTLSSVRATFLNTHMGITPKYRGVHGGYWALVMNDVDNCGVTVHLVDSGIDTGGILFQDKISITKKDNINTYPILQLAKAVPLMKKAIIAVHEKNEVIKK